MFTLATITITLGWWILPAIITIVMAIGLVIVVINDQRGLMAGMQSAIFFLFALSVSAISWLIWSLCN